MTSLCGHGGIGRRVRLRGVWETVRVQVSVAAPQEAARQYCDTPLNKQGVCFYACGFFGFFVSRTARAPSMQVQTLFTVLRSTTVRERPLARFINEYGIVRHASTMRIRRIFVTILRHPAEQAGCLLLCLRLLCFAHGSRSVNASANPLCRSTLYHRARASPHPMRRAFYAKQWAKQKERTIARFFIVF